MAIAAAIVLAGSGSGRPALQAQSNPIVVENAQMGDIDWDIVGAGDPTIQGFATDISVNTGQTVNFKIQTDSANFQIEIYRLGYYGGAGARKVATLPPITQSQNQAVTCATDAATGLVDCGNWTVSASWPSTGAVSGIYVAKLTRIDTGGASHIVFVVRDDARHADLLFQTSDTTWQAYNTFGGNSLYCGLPGVNPPAYDCEFRAYKVSYNRPFDTRDSNPQSWLFNAEYPMLRWLEANGYDVSYFTGVDSDRSGAEIKNHKAFLSVGHDEYWSAGQRTNVESARDAGVHLAFFSGNEVFWKTRWEDNHRTLVSYKETLNGAKIDPTPTWTGTWRDASFSPPSDGGRPENGLTGTIWTVNCCSYAITVPSEMLAQRFWRNTGLVAPPGGVATLAADTLGYEWDEDLDNGFRPSGLTRLSSTTVDVPQKLAATDYSVGPGTATHALTLHRKNTLDQQGNIVTSALVFGAGTVQWSWGLDGNHDRGGVMPGNPNYPLALSDLRMQQATVNLFADMGGVQPGSIQSGLSTAAPSTDTAAPTSTITSPSLGSTVASGGSVTIRGTATDSVGGVVAGVEVSTDGGATWHPATGASSWTYAWTTGPTGIVTIRSRATDDSGNVEVASPGILVSVNGSACPCNHLWNPATSVPATPDSGDPAGAELGVRFSSDIDGFITGIRFYKSGANAGTHIGKLWTGTGTLLASATFTNETGSGWQEVSFPAQPIAANTIYVASYNAGAGHYSADHAYFAQHGVDSAPLHAPVSGAAGNGVFNSAGAFPTQSALATNYWVDVTFAQVAADASGPVISQIRVSALDGNTAVVTWKTNEAANSLVEYATVPTIPGPPGVSDAAFVTDHSITVTGLSPSTAYNLRITSGDAAVPSNTTGALTTFTMPGPTMRDTTSSDFSQGVGTGTYVAETANGEVILAPTVGSEFSGTTLPAGWSSVPWFSGGTAAVGGGAMMVDGARVAADGIYGPGHSLEFVATFAGDVYQHSGLGVTFNDPPWAMFSTGAGGGALFTRTYSGSGFIDTPLGAQLLGSPHRFRIEWTAPTPTSPSKANYFVDGTPVASDLIADPIQMRPIAASDLNPNGGNIVVDWMRMSPYALAGSFQSRVFNAMSPVSWNSIQWTSATPAGTSLAISVRTGNVLPFPDVADCSLFTPILAPGALSMQGQYIQYCASLTTTDPSKTPELQDIVISTDQAPVAVNDSAATDVNTPYTFAASGLIASSLKFNDSDPDTPFAQLRINAVSAPMHGAATLNSNGSVTYFPPAGYSGPDSFTYTLTDGLLTSNAATVSMSVGVVIDSTGITWANPAAITYGTPLGGLQLNATATSSGGLPVPGTFVYEPPAGTVLGVAGGLNQTLKVTFTPDDLAHFTIAVAMVHIKVNPAVLTVSADDKTKVYGTANPELTSSVAGFVNGDTAAVVSGSAALSTTATTGSPVGAYPITPDLGTLAAANYSFAFVNGTLTVNTATLTVTADNKTKVYGTANPELTATITGFVNGDTAAVVSGSAALSTTATAASPVVAGGYPIAAAQGTLAAANYSFAFVNGTLTVNEAALIVTADNKTKAVGTANPPLTVTYAGFVNGDTAASLTTPPTVSTTATTLSPVGTYPITAGGAASPNYTFTYVGGILTVVPSATLKVTFIAHAMQDDTPKPKVVDMPVEGALVRVFTKKDVCTSGVIVSGQPKLWGKIFETCPVVMIGTYRAEGTTNAAGQTTIIVPPTSNSPNTDYVVIGKTTGFDYLQTGVTPDPLYSAKTVGNIGAGATKSITLHQIRTFKGKRVAGRDLEEFGSYLAIVQPDFMDWDDDKEQYPFVLVADGAWDISTGIAAPSGFVSDSSSISTSVQDATTAIQFTLTDVGSDWTETNVTHVINHKGTTRIRTDSVQMFNRKRTKAKADFATVDPDSTGNAIDVLSNDGVAPPKTLSITAVTQGSNGTVAFTSTGVTYTPNAGFIGRDEFTYTIDDGVGGVDIGTVNVRVSTKPSLMISDVSMAEGNVGTTPAVFTVTLSSAIDVPVTFDFTTADNTAVAGTDYTLNSGTIVIPVGETSATIAVQVIGNTVYQTNRNFAVQLSNVINKTAVIFAGAGRGVIVDDDPKPSISVSNVAVVEGNAGLTPATVTVTLSGATALPATVNYTTADGSAIATSDYVADYGTLTFAPGETTKTVTVQVVGDAAAEATESFFVAFSNATGATLATNKAVVTIIDDDSTSWISTSVADFNAGTLDAGAYISRTNNGEVILAPTVGAEFQGKQTLPNGWIAMAAPNGAVTMGGNFVSLDGGSVQSVGGPFAAGRSLEFSAVFSGAAGQNAGFSASNTGLAAPYAMFGTKVAGTLLARSVVAGTTLETPISGNMFNGTKKFRIDWNATTIVYWVDDKKVATHTISISQALQPTALDLTVGDGALAISYMRMTPYAAAGNYTSAAFDAGAVVAWLTATWSAAVPAGTSAVIQYRTGNTPTPDGTWTPFTTVPTSGAALTGSARYFQFTVQEATTDAAQTPVVKDVTLAFRR